MQINRTLLAATALAAATPAFADDAIAIRDAYLRVSSAMAISAGAFMVIENEADADDRLIGAASTAAERVELHTTREDDAGVMRMIEIEDGFVIPGAGAHELARGGDHIMLMGLTAPLEEGDSIELTLTFENAGDIVVEVPVDSRRPAHDAMHGQGH